MCACLCVRVCGQKAGDTDDRHLSGAVAISGIPEIRGFAGPRHDVTLDFLMFGMAGEITTSSAPLRPPFDLNTQTQMDR